MNHRPRRESRGYQMRMNGFVEGISCGSLVATGAVVAFLERDLHGAVVMGLATLGLGLLAAIIVPYRWRNLHDVRHPNPLNWWDDWRRSQQRKRSHTTVQSLSREERLP